MPQRDKQIAVITDDGIRRIATLRHDSFGRKVGIWLLIFLVLTVIFLAGVHTGTSGVYTDLLESTHEKLPHNQIYNFLLSFDKGYATDRATTRSQVAENIEELTTTCEQGFEEVERWAAVIKDSTAQWHAFLENERAQAAKKLQAAIKLGDAGYQACKSILNSESLVVANLSGYQTCSSVQELINTGTEQGAR